MNFPIATRIGRVPNLRIGLGGEGGGLSSVSIDGTSGKYAPNSAIEWAAFLPGVGSAMAMPDHLWRLQETAGNLADSIGSKTLSVSSSVLNKAIAGWSRVAVGGPGSATNTSFLNGSMVDTSTTSFAVFTYARFDTPGASVRSFITYATPAMQLPATTNKVRLREGGSLVDSANAHNSTVHPFLFVFNVTAQTVMLYTDLEKMSVTWSASSGSGLQCFTSTTVDVGVNDFLYMSAWDGPNAETATTAEAKKFITGLGYTPPWS